MSVFWKNRAANVKKLRDKLKSTGEIILSNSYGVLEEELVADSGGGNSNNPQPVEGTKNVFGEKRTKEVEKLRKGAKNLNFLGKMQKQISYEERTLDRWLSDKKLDSSIKGFKADFISILGEIVKCFVILHLEKQKAHRNVTVDNVCICDGRVKLVNSSDLLIGSKELYKQDFLSLKDLSIKILGERQNHPEDLLHFFDLIEGLSEGPGSFDWNWILVYNHPVFWPMNKRINFMLNIRLDYLSEHWSQFGGEFRDAVCSIPSDVTDGWVSKAEKISTYNKILRDGDVSKPIQEKYSERNVAMAFLTFSRDSLKHAGKYVTARTQEKTARDLYILSPRFLPCLVQRSIHLRPVREAASSP